jgi:hypothetical protein
MIKLKDILTEAPTSRSIDKALNHLRFLSVHVFPESAQDKWNLIKYMHKGSHPLGKYYRALQKGDPTAKDHWQPARKFIQNRFKQMIKGKSVIQKVAMKELDSANKRIKV